MGRRNAHLLVASILAAPVLAVVPTAAAADKPPTPAASGISQYVEMIPTSSGQHAIGVGKATTKPLPKREADLVRKYGGTDKEKLETVATSSEYGAPAKSLPVKRSVRAAPEVRRVLKPKSAPEPRVIASSVGAVTSTAGGGRTPVALALLLATTIALAIVAARRGMR
jgi:hypothetical protein